MGKSIILVYQQRIQQYLDRMKRYEQDFRSDETEHQELLDTVKKAVLETKTLIDNLYEEVGVTYFEDEVLDRQYKFSFIQLSEEKKEQLEHSMFMTDNAMKLLDKVLYLDNQKDTYNLVQPKKNVPVIEESEL